MLLRLLLHRLPLLCCLLLAPEVQLSEGSSQERRQQELSCQLVEQPKDGCRRAQARQRTIVKRSRHRLVCQAALPAIESYWLLCKRVVELLR
ncbi:MAG: hypothetical protein ACOCXA_04520 [Planctomycetota bacterium]